MRRREVLAGTAVGITALLAGCAGDCHGGDGVTFEPVDPEEVVDREVTTDVGTGDRPTLLANLATRTLAGETPEVETTGGSPLSWLTYAERDGTIYEIREETVDEGTVTAPEYDLSRDREMDDDVGAAETLAYEDLPRHDRWRATSGGAFYFDHLESMSFTRTSVVAGYLDERRQETSILADGVDADYLEYDGSVARLEHSGEGSTDAARIRYDVDPVAEDAAEFADYVFADRGATLENPSENLEEFLAEVKEDGGRMDVCGHELDDDEAEAEEAPRREAVEELRATLEDLEEEADAGNGGPPGSGIDYLRYEGQWYRVGTDTWAV
ncbi:hypothetical protein [Natrarchaeobaculum aegyptiacum]|uniref:Uncharacterized protein n=1 Tax=Natrarchaeobaculum aegyptiacum TaxID=745377 RepID=A0A2Z2HUE3_9EURY|nr:hypothetical protein [Natrarchaeobaculum aegyptiacum]ARS90881.1 hypothetical protein B1756_14860 [Natrarchaeobaculum aegyptiacum]